jgi:WD40 repeat protein/tetratricopeptide (TPR) repeat protein
VAGLLASLLLVAAVSGVLVAWSYTEALRQTQIAQDERDAARTARDRERKQLRQTERVLTNSRVAQANTALRDNDQGLGLSLLESCPPQTRFWEWYYTRRLCRGAPFTLHQDGEFQTAVFSPDGRWLATTGGGGLILIDARSGAERWRRPNCFWRPAVFSPDSGRVACWWRRFNQSKQVTEVALKVWEVPGGKEVLTIPARDNGSGGPIVFSADGQWLACAGVNHTTAAWDTRTGKQRFAVPLKNAGMFYNASFNGEVQLACTPDGSLAVYDGEEVRFLDPRTGKVRLDPRTGEERRVAVRGFAADFSPDGRSLALKDESGAVRVLNLDTGGQRWAVLREYLGAGRAFLKYSPDGERLAFLYGPKPVRLFDGATGNLVGTLPMPNKQQVWPGSLSFSGDGQRLAVCGTNAVEVWNVRDLTDGLTLRAHTEKILALTFPPVGRQLLTVANTGAPTGRAAWEVRCWDVDGGFTVATRPGHPARSSCAAFSANADRVAVGASDSTVRIWGTETGRERLVVGLEGTPTDLAFGPHGDFLAVLVKEGNVGRILILDTTSGRKRRVIEPQKPLEALALSPDGRSVAGVVLVTVRPRAQIQLGERGVSAPAPLATLERIQVWSVQTGAEGWRVALPPNRILGAALAYSPDGRWLAGNTTDRTVTLWEAQTGTERLQFKFPANDDNVLNTPGNDHSINTLAFSADSQRLATGGGLLKVWDTQTGQEVYSLKGMVNRLAFRADNLALAVARPGWAFIRSATVSLLSAETVPSRTYLEGSSDMAVFSPDGRLVAAAGPENDILLFDALSGRRLRRLEGHRQPMAVLVFSANAKRLLSAGLRDEGARQALRRMPFGPGIDVKEVKVWDVETGKQLARFDNLDRKLAELALSADGSRVAATFGEYILATGHVQVNAIQVWDVANRRRRAIPCKVSSFGGLAFAEDGKVIATLNQVGKVAGWSVQTGRRVTVAHDPFARPVRTQRTADGRRLWSSGGRSFIQPEPDARQRARLRAQARPDPAWHAEWVKSAEYNKHWFAAAFHLGRLLLKSPGDVSLRCRRARALIGLKLWDEARADCEAAIRLQPQSVEARVTRALLASRQGELEEAQADLARAAAAAPDDPAVAAWQAFLYVVSRQREKAAAAEKRMLERLPLLLGVTATRPDAAHGGDLGGEVDPVWTLLKGELTQRLAADARAQSVFGATTVGLGGAAMGQGPLLAIPALIARTTDANVVPLLRLRGLIGVARGNNGWEGYNDFRTASRQAPEDVLARKGMACAIWRVLSGTVGGSWLLKEGLDACDAALRLDPEAWDFWYLRGLFCARMRQHAAALKAFTRALELHADFAPALRERGAAHAELGQWAGAVKDLTRAAELTGPADPTPWDLLALAQLGRRNTAADRAYKKTCTRMLAMFGRTPPLIWAGGAFAAGPFNAYAASLALHVADQSVRLSRDAAGLTAVLCTTRPDALADWQRLVQLTRNSPDDVRGKVFCRTGRYEEAVNLLKPLRKTPAELENFPGWLEGGALPPAPTAVLTLYLALAEHGRGRTAEAKRLLEETTVWLAKPSMYDPKQSNRDGLAWTERVQIDQLRRELEALLKYKAR